MPLAEAQPVTMVGEGGLSARVLRASAWMVGLQVVVRVTALIRIAVLARLLGPRDFGVVAIALVAMSCVQAFTSPGVAVALLQPGRHERPLLDTAWTLLVVRGAVVSVLMFLSAPLVGAFFDSPEAVAIVRVVALAPLLEGLGNIGVVEFRRSLMVGRFLFVEACGPIADMVVSIALGLWLRSAWALVGGWMALWAVRFAVTYVVHPYRPRWHFDRDHARRLLGYGRWVSASTALAWLLADGVHGVVGRVLGVEALGFFRTARPLGMLPTTELAGLMSWVTVPAYARLQGDPQRARSALRRVLGSTAVLVVPAALTVAVFARPVVGLLLGEKWIATVPLVQVFAVMGLFRAISAVEGAALLGLGRPSLQARALVVELMVVAVSGFWLVREAGTLGIAVATALGAAAGACEATRGVRQAAGATVADVVSSVGGPVLACAPALAIAFVLADRLTGVAAAAGAGMALLLTYVVLVVLLERVRLVPHGLMGLARSLRGNA